MWNFGFVFHVCIVTFVQENTFYDDSEGYYGEPTLADMVTEFLGHLSSSPGSFESDIEYITGMFNSWVNTEELLNELVELIYTQVRRDTFTPHFAFALIYTHLIQVYLHGSDKTHNCIKYRVGYCFLFISVYSHSKLRLHRCQAL